MSSQKNEDTSFPVKTGHYLVGNEGIYKVGEFLGEGSYGKVAKCTKLGSQEIFAIKITKKVENGMKEFEAMKLIKDLDPGENNMMKMYECFSFQNVTCLVYEILEENLIDRMGRQDFEPEHLCKVRALAQQMFQALNALKSIGVVHGDVKLDNIMYVDQKSLNIKLVDFGMAIKAKELSTGCNIQITPFRAPEVILGLPMDESIDMWALGVVLASVYTGDVPFPCGTEYETIRAMTQIFGLPEEELLTAGEYTECFFTQHKSGSNPSWRLLTPDEYTKNSGEPLEELDHVANLDAMIEIHKEMFELYDDDDQRAFNDLLKRMLEVNPKKRITPSQALAHDFITMKHLSGKSKAEYAATAENVMRKIKTKDMKVDPPAPNPTQ